MFPVNIFQARCRSSNQFRHLRHPIFLLLPSHMSSTAVSIPVILNLRHCACPPLSSPLILSAIPSIPDQRYVLRLVVVPCRYFPSTLPCLQPILPCPLSHISSVAVPHLLCRHIHPCCPASPPMCSSAAVFTSDLVYHTYLPRICCGPNRIFFHRSVYFAAVVCLPSPVGSSHCYAPFCTKLIALI